MKLMELMKDPVRSRIYFEIMLQGQVTAQQLMNYVSINRSTLTHHLTKMVETDLLDVGVQSIGRPVKYYSLNDELKESIIVEECDNTIDQLMELITFIESSAAHLQVIANLAREEATRLSALLEEQKEKPGSESVKDACSRPILFSFTILTEEGSKIWNKKLSKFLNEVEEEIKGLAIEHSATAQSRNLAYLGMLPVVRRE
ncbi:MAG: ArsR family transcriptional regulator [Candidatus Thorarchaeota archaeon]|jgi:DNA-binding transcriptional ArsR family regulator